MRARRVAVLRAEGRRRLRILVVVLSLVAIAAAAWGVSLTPLLDIDEINVSGAGPARSAEILRQSGVTEGSPMMYLDSDGSEQAVMSLPWVRTARVWRDWPGTVNIAVEPRVPVATVPAGAGRSAVIDAHGYVVAWDEAPGPTGGLVHVEVPFNGSLGEIHTAADAPLTFLQAIPSDLRAWIAAVTFDPATNSVGLQLVGGAVVDLGEPVLVDDKIASVRAALAQLELQCLALIDVVMPDLPTVTRHPGCARLTST